MSATAYGAATKGVAPPPVDIDDDLYPAHVKDVEDSESTYNDQTSPQYKITWEFDDVDRDDGQPLTLLSWVRIPDGLIADGLVNEKSNLYALLMALGYTDENLVVDPDEWQGQGCRVVVENKEIKSGDNAGQIRPRITGYKPSKKGKGAEKSKAAAPKAAKRRRRDEGDEDF